MSWSSILHVLCGLLTAVVALRAIDQSVFANPAIDFVREVAPVFERHCIRCHQPASGRTELSLATISDLTANEYVIPGRPDESHLFQVVTSEADQQPLMPKEGAPLSDREVAVLRRWIAEGARWPADFVIREQPKADLSWWSLQPLATAEPPAEGIPDEWSASPIDQFVYAQLLDRKLRPNGRADRRTLIRRVTYDLTGLPPTPEEIDAFLADESTGAYERLIDRLLASPRYGEHWGRHWLDVARFGESTGYEVNHVIDNAWPFRDYIIQSLNDDKPFDRFVKEHLAGDALGGGDPAVEVGLTFLVCGPVDIVGNADAAQAAQIRADTIDEMIRATSEAFLGLTVGCARCHDHKFDPISQQDYYRLFATFSGVYHGDRMVAPDDDLQAREQSLAELERRKQEVLVRKSAIEKSPGDDQLLKEVDDRLAEIDRQIAAAPILPELHVGRFEQPTSPQHVFIGGDAGRKGEPVAPASIDTLANVTDAYALPSDAPEQERRLALARWLVAPDNPLTPRVLVNRLWHYQFGTGIVSTPGDFGYMGDRPTHPELLDWLARQLVDGGWRLKPLHKLIVMSETYRQASTYRQDAARVDADARLLWRFPPRRLAAEEIRDAVLLLAGQLDERRGGPGFRLYEYTRDNVATYTPLEEFGPETYRRSVYHQNARASLVDVLTDFDAPDCAYSVSRRTVTTTPSQALVLMNHRFTIDMAESFAARLTREVGSSNVTDQVKRAFELAYGRPPVSEELNDATTLVQEHGLRALCRAMINSSELIYVN